MWLVAIARLQSEVEIGCTEYCGTYMLSFSTTAPQGGRAGTRKSADTTICLQCTHTHHIYLKTIRVLNDSIILSMYYKYSTTLSLKSSSSKREKLITPNIVGDPIDRGGYRLRVIRSSNTDCGTFRRVDEDTAWC